MTHPNAKSRLTLILLALLFVPARYAQSGSTTEAPPPGPQESPICRFLYSQLDRPINSFERDFGAVISRTQESFKLPSQVNEYGKLIKMQFENHVSLSYVVVSDQTEQIIEIKASGIENLRKLGLNVSSVEDIKRLFGNPNRYKANIMTYECDMYAADFSVSPSSSVAVTIHSQID